MVAAAFPIISGCFATTSEPSLPPIETQQLGDNSLTCADIKAQVLEMEKIMGQAGITASKAAGTQVAAQAGTQAAYQAAAQAAPSSIPYLGSLISGISSMSAQQGANAQQRGIEAQTRRSYLIQLHNQKKCK